MTTPRTQAHTAWGRTSRSVSRTWRAGAPPDVAAALRASGARGLIARGYGRSYGDVCQNDGGDVVDATVLRAIHRLDATRGLVVCDAGASFADVTRHCVPLGWLPPVCPGTAIVSMGGAVANDVHGKNQHRVGSFGDHVEWLELLTPDGVVRRVGPSDDPELFAATVGGIGLTGVILAVALRLERVPSNAMHVRSVRVRDLDHYLELLESSDAAYPYVVGWHDALARGPALGRGVLELGRPAEASVRAPLGMSVRVPFEMPAWLLSRATMRLFNAAYLRHVPSGGLERRVHVERFLYPLDALHDWNRMYGRRGFYQFQCVVPPAEARRGLRAVMGEVVRREGAPFLSVIKRMAHPGRGLLSFPAPGCTLALDFARSDASRALIERLHDIVLEHGGRVYLAKDACLTPERMRRMYPGLARFREVLARVDPQGIMQSDMSRRLELRA